jgi:hypothetical protein
MNKFEAPDLGEYVHGKREGTRWLGDMRRTAGEHSLVKKEVEVAEDPDLVAAVEAEILTE